MTDELLSPDEVARRLRVTDKQARVLMRKMEHVDLGGGLVRVSAVSFNRFVEAATCKTNSTVDPDHSCIGTATPTEEDSPSNIAPEPQISPKLKASLLSLAAPPRIRPTEPRTKPKTAAETRLRRR